jgi:hypothetical protein
LIGVAVALAVALGVRALVGRARAA